MPDAPASIDPRVIADRLKRFHTSPQIEERVEFLAEQERTLKGRDPSVLRTPYFCSGCPHNTSTKVPEGSRALAGIGCHYMAQWMDRNTDTYTHMGGEGATWVGQAPFTDDRHVFVNIGDGTFLRPGTRHQVIGGRIGRQGYLQDPVQRRRGDDRRPADGWAIDGPAYHPATAR